MPSQQHEQKQSSLRNEGEENRTADRDHRNSANDAVEVTSSEQVEARAADARDAVDGDEGVTLDKAREQAPRGHEKNG